MAADGRFHLKFDFHQYSANGVVLPPHTEEKILSGSDWFYFNSAVKEIQIHTDQAHFAEFRDEVVLAARTGAYLDGYVDLGNGTGTTLVKMIRGGSSRIDPKFQTVDGVQCCLVTTNTTWGKLSLWLSPSNGYLPAKGTLEPDFSRTPDSYVGFTLDSVTFGTTGSNAVMLQGRYESHSKYGDYLLDQKIVAHRNSIELNPDFAANPNIFAPSDAAEGSRVIMEDAKTRTINYIWKQGKAVPYMDPAVLDQIKAEIYHSDIGSDSSAEKLPPPTAHEPSPSSIANIATTVQQNGHALAEPVVISPVFRSTNPYVTMICILLGCGLLVAIALFTKSLRSRNGTRI